MHIHRSQSNPISKSAWLPLLACAALGASGLYSAARADEKQEKKEIKVIVTDDDNIDVKQSDAKISDEDRKKLHAELEALTKERAKLDEKIRSLRGKLGERVQAFAFVNGKRLDLSSDALSHLDGLGKSGEKRVQLFLKHGDGKADDLLAPHIETLNLGKDGEKRIELRLQGDLNGHLDALPDLSPEQRQQMEKHFAEADIQFNRASEKMPKLLEERTIILNSDKALGGKGQVRILRSDSDSRIRQLEKRIEALEKRLKMKMKAEKSADTFEQELF